MELEDVRGRGLGVGSGFRGPLFNQRDLTGNAR